MSSLVGGANKVTSQSLLYLKDTPAPDITGIRPWNYELSFMPSKLSSSCCRGSSNRCPHCVGFR
jgi:hypothetical protein